MQVGDAQIPVLGAIAGEVVTRLEALLAGKFEPRLNA
jgi:hypothetical protein